MTGEVVHVHTIYIYMCVYVCGCVYLCMCMYIYMCMYMYVYVCVYIYMYIYMYVYVYVCISICIYIIIFYFIFLKFCYNPITVLVGLGSGPTICSDLLASRCHWGLQFSMKTLLSCPRYEPYYVLFYIIINYVNVCSFRK